LLKSTSAIFLDSGNTADLMKLLIKIKKKARKNKNNFDPISCSMENRGKVDGIFATFGQGENNCLEY
jgi:hypothetical protein